MIKENKDFFLYVLGIIGLFILTLLLLDFLSPGTISNEACGLLNFKCWFKSDSEKIKTYNSSPQMVIDTNKEYKAVIKTSLGDFEVNLFKENAEKTVNNFVFLVNENYYDGVKFHRIVKGFIIQTGDRNTLDSISDNDGQGGPGYTFEDEINWESLDLSNAKKQQLENLGYLSDAGIISKHLVQWSIAMANSGPDTNGSQFFVVTGSSNDQIVKGLEGRHTVFGEVSAGFDVVKVINNVQVDNPNSDSPKPTEDIVINDIEIQEK
jgi:cyclophilin family peptidyl-prolyl cis-trans isomerase